MELVTGYSFTSEDGVSVRIEETPERERVVLSLIREGKAETASLNREMFNAFMDLKYKLTVNLAKAEKEEVA
jgi:hypothetical protein